MARGKIYPYSLVVADKYSAGYCQVKLNSTAVLKFVYILVETLYLYLSIQPIHLQILCWLMSGAFIFMARSKLMNLNRIMNIFPFIHLF